MKDLINITTNEEGKQVVSAKELYLGLGLNKSNWSRWYPKNIESNEYFKENIDWMGVRLYDEGNETMDFAISIEFAKHIAMMARTEKSHEYRNYFIECEKKVVNQFKGLSKELQAIFVLDNKIQVIEDKIKDIEENTPLSNYECEQLQSSVRKRGTEMLGGKGSSAYKDKSIRAKVYSGIQHEIKINFGVTSYKAIKRKQLDKAIEIVNEYKLPIILQEQIEMINKQIYF